MADKKNTDTSFRHKAAFGKRIEHYIIGLMLKEGLDCYLPLVDDDGIDVVIRKEDGTFIEVQIKACSKDNPISTAAQFSALVHPKERDNYYFIFYSEILNKFWILSSKDFLNECKTVESGKNKNKKWIRFHTCQKNKAEPLPKFDKYSDEHFLTFKNKTN